MDQHKIDFLKTKHRLDVESRRPFVFFGKIFAAAIIVTAVAGTCLSFQVPTGGDSVLTSDFPHISLFSALRGLIQSNDKKLTGEKEDRINLLLLGVGGTGHQGPELTDTMIFSSLRPSDKSVGLLSIPRDLYVPVSDEGWRKINAVNALAEANEDNSGPQAVINVLEPLLNQKIHYYIKVDFDGFAELIDELGGLNVYVEKSFSDSQYPIPDMGEADCGSVEQTNENGEIVQTPVYDCRFEVVTFQEGWTKMDGETALQYVRSRHGTNGEASDFARSRRQENLLLAIKETILNLDTLKHPSKISAILSALEEHIHTNLSLGEIIALGRDFGSVNPDKIITQVLDTSEGSPLYSTSMNGAFVILPKNDDWSGVQKIAANLLSEENLSTESSSVSVATPPDFPNIEIQNGTTIAGLAFQTSQLVEAKGFNVVKIGNAEERGFKYTIIYDLTSGQKVEELKKLQEFLEAEISMSASGWIYSSEVVPKEITVTNEEGKASTNDIDFLVILGEDSSNLVRK